MGLLSEDCGMEVPFCRRFSLHMISGCVFDASKPLPMWLVNFLNDHIPALTLEQAANYFKDVVIANNQNTINPRFIEPFSTITFRLNRTDVWQNDTKHEYQIVAEAGDNIDMICMFSLKLLTA